MDLGKPIGQQHTVPSDGFDQGEHGAGTGLSGGHGHVGTHNTQAGLAHASQSGSSGVPTGTPIADKFASSGGHGQESVAGAYAGGGAQDGLTGQSNAHRTGAGVGPLAENLPTSAASAASGAHHGHSHGTSHGTSGTSGAGSTGAVSGAYAGGSSGNALTGESHAHRTGAGVGPLGENLHAGSTAGSQSQSHSHGARDAALAGTAGGALAGAGLAGVGSGVGPAGGAGGHYSEANVGTNQLTENFGRGTGGNTGSTGTGQLPTGGSGNSSGVATDGLASGTGASGAGVLDAQRAGAQAHREGNTGALGAGAAGLGAGAVGAGALAGSGAHGVSHDGQGKGGVNTSAPQATNERGAPIVDPKELDHGGRHGLIYDEASGKYVHRHEVEEGTKRSAV